MKEAIKTYHRFIDEAGDTTFYLKGKKNAIGSPGVSSSFIMGMVKISDPLDEVRAKITALQNSIAAEPFYQVPSVLKKTENGGYYLHATDDLPEVRKLFFDLINTIDCSLEAVVGRKSIELFETKHKGREEYFYADLLSHLLKNKFQKHEKLVLNIAEKGRSTKYHNLNLALLKAKERFTLKTEGGKQIKTNVLFEVKKPSQEPLLNLADYLCWAVQRVFEKGEIRYYNLVKNKISLVVDLYDTANYQNWGNYYDKKKPLMASNKISPHVH
jgi:hypothetical protein